MKMGIGNWAMGNGQWAMGNGQKLFFSSTGASQMCKLSPRLEVTGSQTKPASAG
ncbi:MAG: hypothetical protein KME30_14575 [Iphinoe sp. HA4291-MV1]|nr:hypothetical protein [Iphinoe sp. HA4291-MV1]